MDYKDLKVRPLNHKNNRLTFSQMDLQSDPPDLLNVQVQSYKDFLQEDVPVSRRLRFSMMINTDKEYMAGLRYIATKYISLSTHYDSDMGLGAGLTFTY